MHHRQKHFYVVLEGDEVEIRAWFEKQKKEGCFKIVGGSYLSFSGNRGTGTIVFPTDIPLTEVEVIFTEAKNVEKEKLFCNTEIRYGRSNWI